MKILNYTELIAWQKAMRLVQEVYGATRNFPKDEVFGLTSQVRKAAISVPSNIAEGQGRKSTREFQHHLSIAHGSLREVETQVLISGQLGYLGERAVQRLMEQTAEVGKLINGLYNSLSKQRD